MAKAAQLRDEAQSYALAEIARPMTEEQRGQMEQVLADRIDALQRGYTSRPRG